MPFHYRFLQQFRRPHPLHLSHHSVHFLRDLDYSLHRYELGSGPIVLSRKVDTDWEPVPPKSIMEMRGALACGPN